MVIIREAPSLAKAYNTAMKSSTAKYKVYLHQDLFIIYKDFIKDFTNVFINSPKLGILGVMGTKKLPKNSIFFAEGEIVNQVFNIIGNNGNQGMICRRANMNFEQLYQKVEAIDGSIMLTQYDISWREDIFDGWHFYDISHSVEFSKAGYDIGVINQKQPWCIHNCGEGYENIPYSKYRIKFIKEYIS